MKNKASSVEIEVQKICFLFKSLWWMWTGGVVPIPVMFVVSVAVWLRRS